MSIYLPDRESELLREFIDVNKKGFFVEVGANDPFELSQSYWLEQAGWRGVLVEPSPVYLEKLRKHRSASIYGVACGSPAAHGSKVSLFLAGGHSSLEKNKATLGTVYEGEVVVDVRTLNSILEQEKIGKVDFISIDVEGFELDVLQGFDLQKYHPDLVLLEDHVFHLRVHRYMTGHGYKIIRRTGLNGWYIPEETPFPLSLLDRVRLWRKYYLGLHWRALKFNIKKSVRASRGEV